jgi:hypothetical protein
LAVAVDFYEGSSPSVEFISARVTPVTPTGKRLAACDSQRVRSEERSIFTTKPTNDTKEFRRTEDEKRF